MFEYKYLKSVDSMQRITRQQLCDDFDNILDRVNKEDIGFVILDTKGNDGQVLCPAYWFAAIYDDNFGAIINCAVRYAIGRETYMPSIVVEFVEKYIDILDTKTIDVILKDIKREREYQNLLHHNLAYDELWTSLETKLTNRLEYLYENKQKD